MAGKRKLRGNKFSDVPHQTPDPDTSYPASYSEIPLGEPYSEPIPEIKLEPEQLAPELVIPESVPLKPRVDLKIYLATSGHKVDQIAGFRHWANKRNLAKQTIPEWRELHQDFNARPTK